MDILPRAPRRYRRYRHENRYNSPMLIWLGDMFFSVAGTLLLMIPVVLVIAAVKYFGSREPQHGVEDSVAVAQAPVATPVKAMSVTTTDITPVAPVQTTNTGITDSDQPDTIARSDSDQTDPVVVADPVVVNDNETNTDLLAIAKDNAAPVKGVIENTDFKQTNPRIVGGDWIQELSGGSFIVQFGTTLDLKRVDEFIPVINNGEPIAVYAYKTTPSGRPVYGIATGVYENRNKARDQVASLPSEARAYTPWIRPITELRLQISEMKLRTE